MIDLFEHPFLRKYKTTLQKASEDSGGGSNACMVVSAQEAIDFDKVKYAYCRELRLPEVPTSNDALFVNDQGDIVFVEFKNGNVDRKIVEQIKQKIYDSVLIYCDIVSENISDLRKYMEYIFVYNENNEYNRGDRFNKSFSENRREVQYSSSYDSIAKTVSGFAKTEYIGFGLFRFANYCFKRVHTFNEAEFEEYLSKNHG